MQSKEPEIEMREIVIRQSYIDDEGRIRDRVKKVRVPTGRLLPDTEEQTQDGR